MANPGDKADDKQIVLTDRGKLFLLDYRVTRLEKTLIILNVAVIALSITVIILGFRVQ